MSEDIKHILENWSYNTNDDLTVRLIKGDDGKKKLQMRIDMGLIQMELDGNPTGETVKGFESWLEYFEKSRDEFEAGKIDDYFTLNTEDCRILGNEGTQYYYRYLSLMKLGDYKRVIKDTERNLRLFGFVNKYADREMDKWAIDQFKPYVTMMNIRAKISLAVKEKKDSYENEAVELCNKGIGSIIAFYKEYGITSEIESSLELSILRKLKSEFQRETPDSLDERLKLAVKEERFEDAVLIRDEIRKKKENKN